MATTDDSTESATNNNSNTDVVVVRNANDDPEHFPHSIATGTAANLGALRGTDAQTKAVFFEERHTNTVALEANAPALLLESPIGCTVRTVRALPDSALYGDDQDDDQEANSEPPPEGEPVHGEIFVTGTQVLFVAADHHQSDSDLAIGGSCVILHAMTEDPEPAVYLQLSGSDDVAEATIVPSDHPNCQKLFDALCKLVSLHPVDDEDEDEDNFNDLFGSGGVIGGGFGDDGMADYGEGSDGLVWAPPTNAAARAATEEERGTMLEHLDNLLEVAPGLELKDQGQFDDAPEN